MSKGDYVGRSLDFSFSPVAACLDSRRACQLLHSGASFTPFLISIASCSFHWHPLHLSSAGPLLHTVFTRLQGAAFLFPGRGCFYLSLPSSLLGLANFKGSLYAIGTHGDQIPPLLPGAFQSFAHKASPYSRGEWVGSKSHMLCFYRWRLEVKWS